MPVICKGYFKKMESSSTVELSHYVRICKDVRNWFGFGYKMHGWQDEAWDFDRLATSHVEVQSHWSDRTLTSRNI
jgi:hypothetical protein